MIQNKLLQKLSLENTGERKPMYLESVVTHS
jgi:hypothetical protein